MATVPEEDQKLIDELNKTMSDLYNIEENAVRNRNNALQRAAHHQILLIRGVIKSIVQYHIDSQSA